MSDIPGQDSSNLGTSQAPVTAPVSNGQDATSNVTTPSSYSTSSQQNENEVINYEERYKALAPKVSQLEKERNEYSKKYQDAEPIVKTVEPMVSGLNKIFSKNKDAYEDFRAEYKEKTGTDLGDYNLRYPSTTGTNIPNNQNQPVDPKAIANEVRSQLKIEEEDKVLQSSVLGFISKHEEFDPNKISDQKEVEEKRKLFKYIADSALVRKSHFPNETWDEAFENVYSSMPQVRNEIAAKAQQTGEKIGRASTINSGVGVSKAPTGDNSGTEITKSHLSKLTEGQRKRYDEHIRRGDTRFAQKYVRNIIEGS